MKIAIDSNILVYLAQAWRHPDDRTKAEKAEALLLALPLRAIPVLPYQVLGETYHVLRRFGYSHVDCRATILKWTAKFETVATSEIAFVSAIDLATEHKLQFWDALIINAAADAGCQMLLSEDLQPGFGWRGVTVVNPFADDPDARLSRILSAPQ